ncbi:MAG: hypothetical protein ABI137_13160 [Antricoccus sp.]
MADDADRFPESPDPDDVPREPSKDELEPAIAYPSNGADDEAAAPAVIAPKQAAWIALTILGLIMLVMMGFGISQDGKALQASYPPAQVTVTGQALAKEKIGPKFTDAEITKAGENWKAKGVTVDPSADQMAAALNSVNSEKQVTAADVSKALAANKVSLKLPTVDSLQKSILIQTVIFALLGVASLVAAWFYRQGAAWARLLGMLASGIVTLMFVMQVLQGTLSLPLIVIVIAGAAAFVFTMKGRLKERVVIAGRGGPRSPGGFGGFGGMGGGGMGGGGLLGGLFRPRPRPEA